MSEEAPAAAAAAQPGDDSSDDGLTAHEIMLKSFPPLEELSATLMRPGDPAGKKMRAIYYLRTIGSAEANAVLMEALLDKSGSPLLRHELAYVLGQLRSDSACDVLEKVLSDATDNVMVRHEAAEALGAIEGGSEDMAKCERLLREFTADSDSCVRESCEVALDAQDYWAHQRWKDMKEQQAA